MKKDNATQKTNDWAAWTPIDEKGLQHKQLSTKHYTEN
jgi:hypothetical protein